MYGLTRFDGRMAGNYTYHHQDMSKISDMISFKKEMDDVASLFKEVTGTELLAMYYKAAPGEVWRRKPADGKKIVVEKNQWNGYTSI